MDEDGRAAQPVQDLRERTKQYALRIVRLYAALPKRGEGEVIGKQMLRSGTAVLADRIVYDSGPNIAT